MIISDQISLRRSTITLPVAYDDDKNNISLIVDFSPTGEFIDAAGDTPANYARVTMAAHHAKMRVFANDVWSALPGPSLGVPHYGGSVEFTLDRELFPGYVYGEKYYGRFCWMDSKGDAGDWFGFAFRGDVVVLRPIHTNYKTPLKVSAEQTVSGSVSLDFANGEVQNLSLDYNATIDLANVTNVIFGEALIVNVKTNGHKLTVVNGENSLDYPDNKTYVVVITNFGVLNLAVTETV